MLLYRNINLQSLDIVREYALKYTRYAKQQWHCHIHEFPFSILRILDSECVAKGLGPTLPPLYFFKNTPMECSSENTHVDTTVENDELTVANISLIIPLVGCAGTTQYWYGGDYNVILQSDDKGIRYGKVKWNGQPTYLESIEIVDKPILCNVSVPHGIYKPTHDKRVTCTIRFRNNLRLEDLDEEKLMC